MKRVYVFLTVLLLLGVGSVRAEAIGSAFGTITTAKAIGQGKVGTSVVVGIADATSVYGSLTYGMSKYWDGRIRLGLYDPGGNADVRFTVGGDFKWQFWNVGMSNAYPMDFALGGFFEFVDFGNASATQIGGQFIVSRDIQLTRGGTLTPYGRFNTRIEILSIDVPPGSTIDNTDSNLEIGVNGGVKWQFTSSVAFFGEFQFDGNDGIFLGVDFDIM
ncbi:MAG: hypothetical protein D6800_12375 [Candidatus Zixiibacteriota bacterium]|nr:MAG: hypothetical protein D6800_12375 [candidate division Zixibacteria bacterium]